MSHPPTDANAPVSLGTFLTPDASNPERVIELAQLTEQVGLDLVTVQDHPYQARFLDTWTLLSYMAARTSRVTLAPNVTNLPLRPPAVLARSAASLDLLSGGRLELGLGTGAFWDAIEAMGGTRLTPGQSVEALEEAIAVIRGLWDTSQRSVRVEGQHHQVSGAHTGPAPAHPIGLWVGAYKPRMLRLVGRLADGWLPSSMYAAPETLPQMHARIDEAADKAGRDPRGVRRLYNIAGQFTARGTGWSGGQLTGTADMWAQELAKLTLEQGIDTYLLATDDPETIRRFAAEVAPAVQEIVAAERQRPRESTAPTSPAGAPEEEQASAVNASTSATSPGTSGAATPAASAAAALGVTPTPDDGTRRSSIRPWDESTRPVGPGPEEGRTYTAHDRATGQHLIDVHDHLRSELEQVQDLVEQVLTGATGAGAARSAINQMTMRQNNWTLGAYCQAYCRVVTTHHTLEDQSMFPHLRRADPRLGTVIDRLADEHEVIHDVLEGLDQALVAFITEGNESGLRESMDLLSDTLLSHLSYEERELVEPLARLGLS